MWAKNLLFLSLIVGGLWSFHRSVFPPDESRAAESPRGSAHRPAAESGDISSIVAKIDAAFAESWRQHDVTPVEPAETLAVARRLSLALTGTIPSLEEIRRFEAHAANDSAGQADPLDLWLRERLADRRFADYWGERLARVYVGTEDGPFLLYRRRRFVSWLAEQLAENRPYGQIVSHLLTDQGLWTDTPATNFITVTFKDDEKKLDENRLASRVSRAMLGVRIDCAECHDHPFESWKQQDFRQLAAFFGQTHQTFTGIRDEKDGVYQVEDRVTGKPLVIEPAVPFAPELLPSEGSRRSRLAHWLTDPRNKVFARATVNRVWALLCGRPLADPVDNVPMTGDLPAPLELLAADFAEHGYNLQRLIRVIATTRVFRLDSKQVEAEIAAGAIDGPVDAEGRPLSAATTEKSSAPDSSVAREKYWAVFPLTRLRPEQVAGSLLQARSLTTLDAQAHILRRFIRTIQQKDFVERYGDSVGDEFEARGGTIPQRLLLMNGDLIKEATKEDMLGNASTRIAALAPSDAKAVETAWLVVLSRRPTSDEANYFVANLHDSKGGERNNALEDLFWTLFNSTEFSWNH